MRGRTAGADDLPEVLRLLNRAADWLHSRGLDQWPGGFAASRIGPMVERGEVFLVLDDQTPIATVTVSADGDTDFWTPGELAEPAHYVSKLAVARTYAGDGLGELLMRWVTDRAARQGVQWVRLDAWRTNRALHAYYLATGWTYVRTAVVAGRSSGVLFQRPAVEDVAARSAFSAQGCSPETD